MKVAGRGHPGPGAVALMVVLACVPLPLPGLAASVGGRSPEVNYALHCRGCHLDDGREVPGHVPPLDASLGRFVRLPEGRNYLVRLPNIASTRLSDADTAELLNWMVRRFGEVGGPGAFAPFTAEEVARSRSAPLVDVEGTRRALVEAVERAGVPPGASGGSGAP